MTISTGKNVLFLDDQPELFKNYIEPLQEDGHNVFTVKTAADAKRVMIDEKIDLAILDANLLPLTEILSIKAGQALAGVDPFVPEEGEGFRIANWIKSNYPRTGVIILTSDFKTTSDQIDGLNQGADDYVLKSTDRAQIKLFYSRVNALLRRLSPKIELCEVGPLALDMNTGRLHDISGRSTQLTAGEQKLLAALSKPPVRPKSRSELYKEVFEKALPSARDRAIDNLISKIRAKVRSDLGVELPIETKYGGGYVLNLAESGAL